MKLWRLWRTLHTFEEAIDVLVRAVSLHDDWLRSAPQRVLLRRSDHLHQLPPECVTSSNKLKLKLA